MRLFERNEGRYLYYRVVREFETFSNFLREFWGTSPYSTAVGGREGCMN